MKGGRRALGSRGWRVNTSHVGHRQRPAGPCSLSFPSAKYTLVLPSRRCSACSARIARVSRCSITRSLLTQYTHAMASESHKRVCRFCPLPPRARCKTVRELFRRPDFCSAGRCAVSPALTRSTELASTTKRAISQVSDQAARVRVSLGCRQARHRVLQFP